MAALLLMITTFVPFSKVLAQGLVEYAIILVLVAFNKNTESAELVWIPDPSQAKPQSPIRTEGDVLITFDVRGANGAACSQTFQSLVETKDGLNVMTIATSNNHLVVNGELVDPELDHNCFDNEDRLLIAVGVTGPPGFDPTVLSAGFQKPEFVLANIVGQDGVTHSSVPFSKIFKTDDSIISVK